MLQVVGRTSILLSVLPLSGILGPECSSFPEVLKYDINTPLLEHSQIQSIVSTLNSNFWVKHTTSKTHWPFGFMVNYWVVLCFVVTVVVGDLYQLIWNCPWASLQHNYLRHKSNDFDLRGTNVQFFISTAV